jgi:uncharacterized protein (UPF0332 family)
VKPEVADYLTKARNVLDGARVIADAGVPEVAAREAYIAAFHAAEAFIFDHTGKAAKTHRGVRSQFNQLGRDEPGIGNDLTTFLAEGYRLKTIADHEVGPEAGTISAVEARAAIDTAARFIDTLAALLP